MKLNFLYNFSSLCYGKDNINFVLKMIFGDEEHEF